MARDLRAIERRVRELEQELERARKTVDELRERLHEAEVETGFGRTVTPARGVVCVNDSAASGEHGKRSSGPTPPFVAVVESSDLGIQLRAQELERLTRMKSEFISIAAHEFRTPMTSIVGYLDLIMEGRLGPVPEPLKKPIASIARNVQRLKRLIEDMLDISRLESGKVTLEREPQSLTDIVEEAILEMNAFVQPGRHQILRQFEPIPPLALDRERMRRAVANILANAIKYSPEGTNVEVVVRQEGDFAVVRVTSAGAAVAEALGERVFEPFCEVTAPEYHSSGVPDTAGLGLAIAKGTTLLHGGELFLSKGEEGQSAFVLRLPLQIREGATAS